MGSSLVYAADNNFEQACIKNLKVPVAAINIKPSFLQYDFSKTTSQLAGLSKNKSENTQLGLTEAQASFEANYQISNYEQSGNKCFTVSFEITLSVTPQKIYIANEIDKTSCLFKEVLDHELKHATYNQKVLEDLRDELTSWVNGYLPNKIYYQDYSKWLAILRADVNSKILPYIKAQYDKRTNELHKALDTDTEYTRLANVCDGQAKSLKRF